MRGHGQRGGVALPAALLALLVAGLVAAATADVARVEVVVARSRRTFAQGLAAVDACLARVASELPAGWDHADVLDGPDGVAGTADDGSVATPGGCVATLHPGPLGPVRALLDVAATVPRGRRRLRAVVDHVAAPTPAAVWATSGTGLGVVTGGLLIDGTDTARPGVAPIAAVATADDAAVVDAWLEATPGATIAAGTPPPVYAPAPPLAEMASRLVAAGAASAFVPAAAAPAPALSAIVGDATIGSPGVGAGVLLVDGCLDIVADFAFSGVVAATGGIHVATGVTLRIAGALWLGAPAFDVEGDLVVGYDRTALDAADALFRLPRPASVAGLLDE